MTVERATRSVGLLLSKERGIPNWALMKTSFVHKAFRRLWLLIVFAVITFSILLVFSNNFRIIKSEIYGNIDAPTRKLVDRNPVDLEVQTKVGIKDIQQPIYSFRMCTGIANNNEFRYTNVTTLVPQAKIPLHVLSKQKQYRDRMLDIRKRCRHSPADNFKSVIDLKRFVFERHHETIMCIVPKNACTTWKGIMMYLMGRTSLEKLSHMNTRLLDLDFGSIKSMRSTALHVAASLFSSMTKFMVSRHPFDRLVSAFRSKFGTDGANYMYSRGRRIAKNGLRHFLGADYDFNLNIKKRNETINKLIQTPAFITLSESDKKYVLDLANRAFVGKITFEEFLRYGIITNPRGPRLFDVHWRPQHMLCNPCAINFDYIIRFENLEEESKHVLDYLERFDRKDRRIEFPTSRSSAVTHSVAKEYFKDIPLQLIESLKAIYEKDFYYFNYHPDQY